MSHINDAANEGLGSSDTKIDSAKKVASGAASMRSLGVGLLMAGSAAGALAGTLSVSEEVELAASPARTWAVIKDFQRWQTWHPAFVSTEITKGGGNAKGTVRVLAAKDGAKFNEELLMHDAAARSYQYRIIDSPLPISGTFRRSKSGGLGCAVEFEIHRESRRVGRGDEEDDRGGLPRWPRQSQGERELAIASASAVVIHAVVAALVRGCHCLMTLAWM
jgi:hypothetical protein